MEKTKIVLKWFMIVWILVVGFSLLFSFFDWRDKQIQIGADTYEKCVLKATCRTPAYWYVETGKYPECK